MPSWTWPWDSCSLRRGMTTSLCSSANCTGWEHQSQTGSSSSSLFLYMSARDSTVVSRRWARVPGRFWGPETPSICFLAVNKFPSYTAVHRTVGDRAFPVAAAFTWILGTVCPNMPRLHPLWMFSEVPSRLSSLNVSSRDYYRNFCSACSCHFRTKIVLFTCILRHRQVTRILHNNY